MVFKTSNSGRVWKTVNSGLTTYVQVLAIDPQRPSTLYAGPVAAGVVKSTDRGGSWNAVTTGLPLFNSAVALAIDSLNTGTLYVGTNGAGIFKSIDGGGRWSPMKLAFPTSASWCPWPSIRRLRATTAGLEQRAVVERL